MTDKSGGGEEQTWRQERITKALAIASTTLPQRDLITLLLLTPSLGGTLLSYPSLWQVIDLREKTKAGDRLVAAVSLKISDKGVETITSVSPSLKILSIYWNVRITDVSIQNLVKNCKNVVDLNLSGCKNITDHSMQLIADSYQDLDSLNITRFTDKVYSKISLLPHLRVLDLCGAQVHTHNRCRSTSHRPKLYHSEPSKPTQGIVGVTDKSLEALSRSCGSTLETLDVNGCINIKKRRHSSCQMLEGAQLIPRCLELVDKNLGPVIQGVHYWRPKLHHVS
ncbi:F-box protein-like protein [Drosera capensis]